MEDKNVVLLSASANTGIGLWTSICVCFAHIFGCESQNFKKKQNKIIGKIKEDLKRQMDNYPDYSFSDFRITLHSKLAFTGTVMGIKNGQEKRTSVSEVEVTRKVEAPKRVSEERESNEEIVVGCTVTNIEDIKDDRGSTIRAGSLFTVVNCSKKMCDLTCNNRGTRCSFVDKSVLKLAKR